MLWRCSSDLNSCIGPLVSFGHDRFLHRHPNSTVRFELLQCCEYEWYSSSFMDPKRVKRFYNKHISLSLFFLFSARGDWACGRADEDGGIDEAHWVRRMKGWNSFKIGHGPTILEGWHGDRLHRFSICQILVLGRHQTKNYTTHLGPWPIWHDCCLLKVSYEEAIMIYLGSETSENICNSSRRNTKWNHLI